MSKYKIVVTDDRYQNYEFENIVLKEIDSEVQVHDFKSADQAKEVLKDADGIIVNLFPMTADVLAACKKCKVISRYGVGYDNVDVEQASKHGIQVTRVPDYCFEDVSDHALALLLASVRKIAFKDKMIRDGEWNIKASRPSYRMAGKTLGLIGYGGIAQCLHRKISGMNLKEVLVYDPFVDPEVIRAKDAVPATLEAIWEQADFISIHTPLTDDTRNMFNKEVFAKLAQQPIVVNTSRGGIINEDDLFAAIQSGQVSAAGLDVFSREPPETHNKLRDLAEVTFSDHAGWYSEESFAELKSKAARNIVEVLTGGPVSYAVNKL